MFVLLLADHSIGGFIISEAEVESSILEQIITLKKLKSVNFRDLSMEEQSKFADLVTRNHAHDQVFINTQKASEASWELLEKNICRIPETSTANLAYLALHSDFQGEFTEQYKRATKMWKEKCSKARHFAKS